MTENLLRHEASPYLLQHKDNPVHWRPWGPAALAEAKAAGKPILLSVGYAACHWCHVMAHESFEDAAVAAVMNRLFVNIKVDREERPDVDQIYMAALHALGEQGGWPLTMFLTPDGEPIWGGTYFPKTPRYGRPGFVQVLEEVARVFREEPDAVASNRDILMKRIKERPESPAVVLDRAVLDGAAERLLGLMDTRFGGIRGAPKFPQTSLLELLWRAWLRTRDTRYREAVVVTLRAICEGGIYDHLGGGFARYSVDDRWLVPHFEKMLYDNAQLVELLTYAWLDGEEPLFSRRIEETVTWLEREMRLDEGAFAASLDADSEGHEGRFYVWTLDEIRAVLGPDEAAFFAEAYDVTPAGNWEGVSILNRIGRPPVSHADEARLAAARARLLAARGRRVRPLIDDKILADWNGLMIAALAFAGASLSRPAWIALAADAFRFVTGRMSRNGRLAHSSRAGKSVFPGLATDYAAMIKAAVALYFATFDGSFLVAAHSLAGALRQHHFDLAQPGYFLPADDAEALILRPRSETDEATPSANSTMAQNLIRLWHLTGDEAFLAQADAILDAASQSVAGNLFAVTGILNALDLRLNATSLVLVRPRGAELDPLLGAARLRADPNLVLSLLEDAAQLHSDHPASGKTAIAGRLTAYVCRGQTCSLPLTDADALASALRPSRRTEVSA
jgi:uncharacterized protein YyaL (SSP411 family)